MGVVLHDWAQMLPADVGKRIEHCAASLQSIPNLLVATACSGTDLVKFSVQGLEQLLRSVAAPGMSGPRISCVFTCFRQHALHGNTATTPLNR